MKLSQTGKMDILWWMNNIEHSFSPMQIPNCSFLLKADASKSGWGAIFDKETTGGHFALDKSLLHINVLELKAVLFGLKSLCSHLRQTHIKVLSDNTTAMCSINNMGSCKSLLCDQEVRKIWSWAIDRDIFITATHIPGIRNGKLDQESRKSELRPEWKSHESIFGYIQKYLDFYPSVDLFASRTNSQLPLFFAYRPDPKAEVINAFCVSWHNLSFYCFPPFSCIGKVLQKIIFDNATGILILPNWPSQFWFTVLQDLLLTEVFIIPPNANNSYLPNQPDLKHPFLIIWN